MRWTHPLLVVPPAARLRVALALVALTLSLTAWLAALDARLRGADGEGGIIPLELCGSVDRCAAQLAAIDARGAGDALSFLLGLDYAYLLAYSTTIAALLVFLAAPLPRAPRAIAVLASLQWVAAGCDALENYALWSMRVDGADATWAAIAFGCAGPKFAVVIAGVLTAVALLIVHAARRARR